MASTTTSPMGDAVLDDVDSDVSSAMAIETLSIVLVLIFLTIVFEKIKHHAEHAAGRVLGPLVDALFGELTVLGFLSVITFCLEKAGLFLALTKLISQELDDGEDGDQDNEVFELVESIHFGMFFIMVIFMVTVLTEVRDGVTILKEWYQWDRACQDEAYVQTLLKRNATKDKAFDAISSMGGLQGVIHRMWRFLVPYFRFLPFLRDRRRETLEDKMVFCSLRAEFLKERSFDPPFSPAGDVEGGGLTTTIGDHCNFGRYLTFAFAKKMKAVIEIDTKTWIIFAGGAVCYYLISGILGLSDKALAWLWVLLAWAFHGLSIRFEQYLICIRTNIIAPAFVPKHLLQQRILSSVNNIGTETEPLNKMKIEEDLPMWCSLDLDELDRKRSRLAKTIFGPTPRNRYHALYLFGEDGPLFHIFFLRVMLVFSCVYSARLAILFIPMLARDEGTTTLEFINYFVLAAIPGLAFIFNRKRTMKLMVQVGCVGPFILHQAVAEAEREEKTSVAVRVLVIFFKFAKLTKQFLADPTLFQARVLVNSIDKQKPPCYFEVLSSEEIAEMGRIFTSFFDCNSDGFFSETEFQTVMSTAGIIVTDKDANDIVRALLKTVGEAVEPGHFAKLSLCSFMQWYANQLGDAGDKEECAEFLFSLFDYDNSGDITVLEFTQTLNKLSIGITHDEAYTLIQQLDEDGNGVLCKDEFRDMVEDFYPIEYEHHCENYQSISGTSLLIRITSYSSMVSYNGKI